MSEISLLNSQLGEAARMIAVALRADYDLNTILKILPTELPSPAAELFAQAGQKVQAGRSLHSALASLSTDFPSNELTSLSAAFSTETNLAASLDELGQAMIARCGSDPQAAAAARRLREAVGARSPE
jgi:Flp pilus assembly protein TadB